MEGVVDTDASGVGEAKAGRKHWLDNVRWAVVAVVVVYHVFYMYNAEGIVGVVGKITNFTVQPYDVFQYEVYPWIMMVLFIVSGIASRLYLERHTDREFIKSRTTKLLVPCTVGLVAFQFIQGYINASIGGAFLNNQDVPLVGKIVIAILSGIGVLWYIQLLWLFSLLLVLVRKLEKDRLWKRCGALGGPLLPVLMVALVVPVWAAAQVLNTPIICVYRFGLYFCVFLLGYFLFSHDVVVAGLKKYFFLFLPLALGLGAAFCISYFGQNYADKPVNRSPLFVAYGWFACLAILGGFARFLNFENAFTRWMSTRSWGLYVFHYLGISAVGLYIAKPGLLHPAATYILTLLAGFAAGYGLNWLISRLPFFRWAVLGIKRKKSGRLSLHAAR
ncbi:MAG: acyltransferase [Treponema sp.]|nr:acyltransferase [Treponema sp.]